MSEKITCPQCEIDVDVTESHCPKCNALMATVGSRDDLIAAGSMDDLDATRVSPDSGDVGVDEEDEDFRTVRMEGLTGMDMASAGISFDSAPAPPPGADPHMEDVEFQKFMVQEDSTVVGGSNRDATASNWTGGAPAAPGSFGAGSGSFPQSGSPYGGGPPAHPPGYVYVEGADSPSETVRQEGISLGRDEALSTFSGPADISRGSGTKSPLSGVMWLGLVIVGLVVGAFFLKDFLLLDQKPTPKKVVFVMLELKTKPSGAEIWMNGKKLEQTTPATVQARIEETAHLQIRKAGFKTIDFKWTPRGNDERSFELKSTTPPKPRIDPKLVALQVKKQMAAIAKRRGPRKPRARRARRRRGVPPGHAALSLVTDPPGAKVRVQGRLQRGRTPLRVILQKGLEAKITIQKYGHHDSYFMWKVQGNKSKKINMYRHSWYNP